MHMHEVLPFVHSKILMVQTGVTQLGRWKENQADTPNLTLKTQKGMGGRDFNLVVPCEPVQHKVETLQKLNM